MPTSIPKFELDRDFGPVPRQSPQRAGRAREREERPAPPAPPPDRYRVRREGRHEVVTCIEAPTVKVHIERGFNITAAEARSFEPGAIFLDGAARGEPFLDPERSVFNLDHHEGCVRPFTLSTCEQAMVLLRRGLDLRKREWTVYANDADLDTLLAVWVLVNHLHLARDESPARAAIMPLLRLQGAIDAQGLELQDLCALPPELMRETRAQMDRVREREVLLKARRKWGQVDLAEYTADRLRVIDGMVYDSRQFENVQEVEELERIEIASGSIAVVCRSRTGIYEVEKQLRRLHGDRLGLVILQQDSSTYSLRQTDPYLPTSLDGLYARLNLLDPAAGGRSSPNRWGGSAEIGGSPRKTGTRLSARQIARACRDAYLRPTLRQRTAHAGRAVGLGAALVAGAAAALLAPGYWFHPALEPAARFPLVLAALASGAFLLASRRAPGLYGARAPTGLRWLLLLPIALAGALGGGVLLPAVALRADTAAELARLAAVLTALPLAVELLFRGLVQGRMAAGFCDGRNRALSRPVILTSVLYALFATGLYASGLAAPLPAPIELGAAAPGLSALLFGIATGAAREHSESVAAPLLLHGLGLSAAFFAPYLVG